MNLIIYIKKIVFESIICLDVKDLEKPVDSYLKFLGKIYG